MEQQILNAGDIAKAVSAIIALLTVLLWKPIRAIYIQHKKDKEEEKAFRQMMATRLDSIESNIKTLVSDVGDMQYANLAECHDFYVGQGWCPSSTKEQLINMHKSYVAKGRNHLSAHYEQEIINLREHP